MGGKHKQRDQLVRKSIKTEVQAQEYIKESLDAGKKRINLNQLADDQSKKIVIKAYLKSISQDGVRNLLLEGTGIEALNSRVLPFEPDATPKLMAQIASAYSREHILEGTTQLQNNLYNVSKKNALGQALDDIRSTRIDGQYILNVRSVTNKFERRMATCKKFSIGNCAELAYMALDYMLRNRPDVPAEICHIKGGDHMFLVIGRASGSDPHNPDTWGGEAYICDPWADAVYPASEYMAKTKNYRSQMNKDRGRINELEGLDPKKHSMEIVTGYDNRQFIKDTSKLNGILVDIFVKMNKKHLTIYDDLITNLNVIALKLIDKYGKDDARVQVIQEKIGIIRSEISRIRENFNNYVQQIKTDAESNVYHAHKEVNDNLQQMMQKQVMDLRASRNLSSESSKKLSYRSLGEIIKNFFGFGKKAPELNVTQEYRKAIKDSENAIDTLAKTSESEIRSHTQTLAKEEIVKKIVKKITDNPEGKLSTLAKELAKDLANESESEIIDLVKEIAKESEGKISDLATAVAEALPEELAKPLIGVVCDFSDGTNHTLS